jgi:hypothetical protein
MSTSGKSDLELILIYNCPRQLVPASLLHEIQSIFLHKAFESRIPSGRCFPSLRADPEIGVSPQ